MLGDSQRWGTSSANWALQLCCFALIAALLIVIGMGYLPAAKHVEDSFIIFRYAENFAAGEFFVWTPGHGPEQGMTGLAWTALLGGFMALSGLGAVEASVLLEFVFAILFLFVAWRLAARVLGRESYLSLVAPLSLTLTPPFVSQVGSGLETVWFILILLTTLWVCLWADSAGLKGFVVTALMTGLVFLTRPDGALFPVAVVGALLAFRLAEDARGAFRDALAFGVTLAGFLAVTFVLAQAHFGYVLPLSFHLKIAFAATEATPWFFILSDQLRFSSFLAPFALLTVLAAIAAGPLKLDRRPLCLLAGAFVYFVYQFSVVPIINIGWRFQLPILVVWIVVTPYLLSAVLRGFGRERWVRSGAVALSAVVGLASLGRFPEEANSVDFRLRTHEAYRELGQAVAPIPGIFIAGTEAGKLPFYSRQPFFDLLGLNNGFVIFNRDDPAYSQLLLDHLEQAWGGLPDLYVRAGNAYAAPIAADYAYLETHLSAPLHDLYQCFEGSALTACALRDGAAYNDIEAALRATLHLAPVTGPIGSSSD